MKIDNKLLLKLERLSKLNIDNNNRDEIMNDLTNIVNFIENLNELDLKNEDKLYQSTKELTKLREDNSFKNEEIIDIILKNAPKIDETSFVVPKIIE